MPKIKAKPMTSLSDFFHWSLFLSVLTRIIFVGLHSTGAQTLLKLAPRKIISTLLLAIFSEQLNCIATKKSSEKKISLNHCELHHHDVLERNQQRKKNSIHTPWLNVTLNIDLWSDTLHVHWNWQVCLYVWMPQFMSAYLGVSIFYLYFIKSKWILHS